MLSILILQKCNIIIEIRHNALQSNASLLSEVGSVLKDHLVIGKQVLGRKWNATIDQIHCQKRRLLIQLQYFFPQTTILQKNIS